MFQAYAKSLMPHPVKAKILLEDIKGEDLFKALKLLKKTGLSDIRYQILRDGHPKLILLFLPTKDMRTAVLRLTEAGFQVLKGINASPGLENN